MFPNPQLNLIQTLPKPKAYAEEMWEYKCWGKWPQWQGPKGGFVGPVHSL